MKRFWMVATVLAVAVVVVRVAVPQPLNLDYTPTKPHHRQDGFVNRYAERADKPGFWRWQWERFRDGLPLPPQTPVTGVVADVAYLQSNTRQVSVTWVGHATVLLQLDGLNILTDPHWSQRASPFSFIGPKRQQPPGVAFDDLPPIHAVLISHNHFDHLDEDTLKRLTARHSNTVRFYVPLGVQHWMQANIPGAVVAGPGQNVFALDWDDTLQLPGQSAPVELQFLAVQHWSARTPWDRYKTLWGSWAVLHPQFRFWFSGDLALSPDTADIGQKLGTLDLAAIAIGAYEPRWFMKDAHVNPAEAIQVMQDVHAKSALGIHWGTFEGLTDESLDQPPQDLARELATYPAPQPDFFVLRHGQTKRYGDF